MIEYSTLVQKVNVSKDWTVNNYAKYNMSNFSTNSEKHISPTSMWSWSKRFRSSRKSVINVYCLFYRNLNLGTTINTSIHIKNDVKEGNKSEAKKFRNQINIMNTGIVYLRFFCNTKVDTLYSPENLLRYLSWETCIYIKVMNVFVLFQI